MDRSIDYVIAVAECRSISQAAEMLYISQPSLSRYLSNLENELGVNLFVRTLNGTELTEAGKIYLEYAKEIKLLRSTMDSKIKALKREKKKRIRDVKWNSTICFPKIRNMCCRKVPMIS